MSGVLINLTFHGVGQSPHILEPGEAEVWLSRDVFARHLDSARAKDQVSITFDDGNLSDFDIALPALIDRGLKAIFFVIVDRIGEPGYLDRDRIRVLANRGMEIGSHGMKHYPWRRLDEETEQSEILDAKEALQEVVGQRISKAACPFGAYDRRSLARLRAAGFETVFTSDGGAAGAGQWLQARNTLRRSHPLDHVSRLVGDQDRLSSQLPKLKRLVKRWR